MGFETPERTPSEVITAKFMDAVRESFGKLLPPGKSMPADIDQQLGKLLKNYPTPNHPPYELMIREAIGKLKNKGGSDEEAVSNSIKLKYKSLPWGHTSLLSHHLKKLTEDGEILIVSNGQYMLPPEEDDTIGLAEKQPEEIHKQQNFTRYDVSQSSTKADLENEQNPKHEVEPEVEPEVDSEQSVAGAEPEGIEKRDELKADHISESEQPKPEGSSFADQEKIPGLETSEVMDQGLERAHQLIVDAVSEETQPQNQENEPLNSVATNLTRQKEASKVDATDKTCSVFEEQEADKTEDADQGLEERARQLIVDAVSEEMQPQNQENEPLNSLATNLTRQEETSKVDATDKKCRVFEEQEDDKTEDADQVLEEASPTFEELRAGRQVCGEHDHDKMEDDAGEVLDQTSLVGEQENAEGQQVEEAADDMKGVDHKQNEMVEETLPEEEQRGVDVGQVLDRTSLVGEEEEAEGQQVEEAADDMKEVDHQQSEMVEETLPEEEQMGGVLDIVERVQEEPNLTVLEDRTDRQETFQSPGGQNQEGVDLENITVEEQIENELGDALADNQRVHIVDPQFQQMGVQDVINGLVLLQDMEIEIEEIEKLIESRRPEFKVIKNGVDQQEKLAGAENIGDNRQQDKGVEMLHRIKGIRACLSDILNPAIMEWSAGANLDTIEPEVPRNQLEKTEVCTPCENVICRKRQSSDCHEPVDVMLIEANLQIYHCRNQKRPADCAVTALENLSCRLVKQPKLSEQGDVASFSGISEIEHPQQTGAEHGEHLSKPSEANSAESKTTLPSSVGGNPSLSMCSMASLSFMKNKEREVSHINSPYGVVKSRAHSFHSENVDPAMLKNQALRSDLSREIQSGIFVHPPLEKQTEGILPIKEGKQPDLRMNEQLQGPCAKDANYQSLEQQRLVSCGKHKKFVSEPNAIRMSTVESSPLLCHQQLQNPGVLLNGQLKQFETGAMALPLLTPSLSQAGWCRESRNALPHLSSAEAAISTSSSTPQLGSVSQSVACQQQSSASFENFGPSLSNSESLGEQQPRHEQLGLSESGSSLFKPSMLSAEALNPLKPAELKKMKLTYRTKLRSWGIPSNLEPEPGLASDRASTGQSPPVHCERPSKQTTMAREESPLTQKRRGRPPKPNPDSGEGLTPKRRGRPPKNKSDAVAADSIIGTEGQTHLTR